jgi:Aldehyde dehydrogenase family
MCRHVCRCTAVKVVLVHDSVADKLVGKVMEKVAKLTVGKPEDNCDVRTPPPEGIHVQFMHPGRNKE